MSLRAFEPEHVALLEGWLRQPHVAPWYPHPLDDLAFASAPPQRAGHWLVTTDHQPIGYLRWQRVDRATLDELGLHEIPAGSIDMDILLGDPGSLGRGHGPGALQLAASEFLRDPTVPLLGLTTSTRNTRAHRGFAKAGFAIVCQYTPPGLEPCHLMTRDLARERATPGPRAS